MASPPHTNLSLRVLSQTDEVWQGEVESITGLNAKGPFDVLQDHGNFIALIYGQITVREPGGNQREFTVTQGRGVVMVRQNKILMFI